MSILWCLIGSAVVSAIVTVCIMNRVMIKFMIHQESEWERMFDEVLDVMNKKSMH